jgi:phosphoenolpyruvate carboxykinase (ATP)
MVNAVVTGKIKSSKFYAHPVFGYLVPEECPEVPSDILDPRNTWSTGEEYDKEALKLKDKIALNFKKFDN